MWQWQWQCAALLWWSYLAIRENSAATSHFSLLDPIKVSSDMIKTFNSQILSKLHIDSVKWFHCERMALQ